MSSGVVTFGLKGGRERSIELIDSVKLISIVTHVCDARSRILHTASTTHRQLYDEQMIQAGVKLDLARLSVGIKDAEDLINDLKQALARLS